MIAVILALIASGTAVWLFRIAVHHDRPVKIRILGVRIESGKSFAEPSAWSAENQLGRAPDPPEEKEDPK